MGGVVLLRALGIKPSVFHINEGHVAFLALELMREKIALGVPFAAALAQTRAESISQRTLPWPPGMTDSRRKLMRFTFHKIQPQITSSVSEFLSLGRVDPKDENETFCMDGCSR